MRIERADSSPLRVGIDPSVGHWLPEVTYTLRTLLRTAGLHHSLVWSDPDQPASELDIYYGPRREVEASVVIPAANVPFDSAPTRDVVGVVVEHGVRVPCFSGLATTPNDSHGEAPQRLVFANDIVFASFWLLTGAREPTYTRDRWDNLDLAGTGLLASELLRDAPVSRYAALLRAHFRALGKPVTDAPSTAGTRRAAFCFTHDVDYPQIIKWIECLRLVRDRGPRAWRSIVGVLRGTNHFWTFDEWIELEKRYGARPTFYFMARHGSLLRYALGTPDDFYDVREPEFTALFRTLREAECEIGLHASFLAYRSEAQLRAERERIEEAAGVRVVGNRHHYWHLDPNEPNETLRRHEAAGLIYDSSLAFERYPGFRRGVCHPFRVFHTGERRELATVQLPPAWMDDHFDRRLASNGITDADAVAKGLIDTARETRGIIVVDYHSRGMNADFYPRYGPWIRRFAERHLEDSFDFATGAELAASYLRYEASLDSLSTDLTRREPLTVVGASRPSES